MTEQPDPMTPEQASAYTSVALCADLEMIIKAIEKDGMVPSSTLLWFIDEVRDSVKGYYSNG